MAQRKGRAPIPAGASGVGQKALTPLIAVTDSVVRVEVAPEHTAGIGFWGDVDKACNLTFAEHPRRLVVIARVAKL